jgi:hypothetical protein
VRLDGFAAHELVGVAPRAVRGFLLNKQRQLLLVEDPKPLIPTDRLEFFFAGMGIG